MKLSSVLDYNSWLSTLKCFAESIMNYHLFDKKQKADIQEIQQMDSAKEAIRIWIIYTVWGNLLPVLIAFGINMMLNPVCKWMSYLNNGAISIVAYNMIISSIFYLQETTPSDMDQLKTKVLGVGSLLLITNFSLFTLQTTSFVQMGDLKNYLTLGAAIGFLYLSYSSGKIMVLLQKKIGGDYYSNIRKNRDGLNSSDNQDDDGTEF